MTSPTGRSILVFTVGPFKLDSLSEPLLLGVQKPPMLTVMRLRIVFSVFQARSLNLPDVESILHSALDRVAAQPM